MKPITSPGCTHVVKRNGVIVSEGGETAYPQRPGDKIIWFQSDSQMTANGRRSIDPEVQAFELAEVNKMRQSKVEEMKSKTAYEAKHLQAKDIIANDNYDPDKHRFIEIEVRRAGKTPMQAALDVIAAVDRAWDEEDKRVKLREELRANDI